MDVYANMGGTGGMGGGGTSPYPYDPSEPPERRPVPPLHLSIDSLTNYVDD
uniref:Uncharacterized protein n=1 Tax=Panagrolaimus sp. ES5 TaxID=591445 RepID=A0AC34G173_9BILA